MINTFLGTMIAVILFCVLLVVRLAIAAAGIFAVAWVVIKALHYTGVL